MRLPKDMTRSIYLLIAYHSDVVTLCQWMISKLGIFSGAPLASGRPNGPLSDKGGTPQNVWFIMGNPIPLK